MRRLVLLLCLCLPAFATISNLTVWEVRPSVGSDTNGGGFVTGSGGTDFSQQNAKNTVGNNISTTDAVANGTTTIISATGSFTAGIVGNIVFFSGGTGTIAAQWRQVVTFTNSTTIVLDTSIAASVGMTMNIGGALLTPTQAFTNAIAENTIWAKATASFTATAAVTLTGQNFQPVSFIGYTTTRGDNGQFTWTTSTNSIVLVNWGSGGPFNYLFQNVIFSSTAGTPGDGFFATGSSAGMIHVVNCSFQGLHIGINGRFSGMFNFPTLLVENTEIKNSVSFGLSNDGQTVILASYIHDNGGDGIAADDGATGNVTGPYFIENCTIKSNGGNGINMQVSAPGTSNNAYIWAVVKNNNIINNTLNGIVFQANVTSAPGSLLAWNNIIDSNGGFGILAGGTPQLGLAMLSFFSNAYRANTSGNISQVPPGIGDVTLSADPFVNRAGNNFALNSTAGGGTACKGTGFPGTLQIGGTGHIDIGALQSAGGGGGGSNPVGFVSQ